MLQLEKLKQHRGINFILFRIKIHYVVLHLTCRGAMAIPSAFCPFAFRL